MAEPDSSPAGAPPPDGPRPPTPRPRGERGRDPVALAAWRRVAEQRRRAVDRSGVAADTPVPDTPAGEPRPADVPAVDAPSAEPASTDARPTDIPGAAGPAPDPSTAEASPGIPPPAVGSPVDEVPAVRASADDAAPGRGGGESASTPQSSPQSSPPSSPPSAPERPDSGDGGPGRLHDVLLGLAGRLDDDALTSVREMVAAEDDAEAAELLGGCLLAGGVGLTGEERDVLRPWFAAARVDAELLGLLPTDAGALDRSVHRFVTTASDRAPGLPLARAARRLPGVVAVRESWRVTPAGSAPGPVPHRVVLVETEGPDDCDHVVHHLAHAARALDATSVEVFAAGTSLPAYHRDALASARPLVADDAPRAARPSAERLAAPTRPVPSVPVPVADDEGETWRTVADAGTAHTATPRPAPPAQPSPEAVEPGSDEAGSEEPRSDEAGTDEAGTDEDLSDEAGDVVDAPASPAADREASSPAPVEAPTPTSIDEDLTSTARRIAALWAQPSPEDFSAPLPAGSLEPTRLEPEGADPAPEDEPDDEAPTGRHGRPPAGTSGTTAFRAPARTNGHTLPSSGSTDGGRDATEEPDTADEPLPALSDAEPDDAQILRARHSRAHDTDGPDTGPARFGHDARFGAGPGPAWPGGPVPDSGPGPGPGPDTLFTSPVEVGEEAVTFGTNGNRHGPDAGPPRDRPGTPATNGHRHDPAVSAPDDEPATGPVAWSGPETPPPPAGPHVVGPPPGPAGPTGPPPGPAGAAGAPPSGPAGPPVSGPPAPGPGPRRPGGPGGPGGPGSLVGPDDDVAPPWAAADPGGWASESPGWSPAGDGGPGRPPQPDATAAWQPDIDDSVAQLSDRERELLARLHEELAQRERAEGADPFVGPPRPGPRPPGPRPPRPGPPGGRTNGHGLPPDRGDDAG